MCHLANTVDLPRPTMVPWPLLPFALVVHAVETVPLGVELREGVLDLHHRSGGGIPHGVGLALVDGGDLLADLFQILLDALQTETHTGMTPRNRRDEEPLECSKMSRVTQRCSV